MQITNDKNNHQILRYSRNIWEETDQSEIIN